MYICLYIYIYVYICLYIYILTPADVAAVGVRVFGVETAETVATLAQHTPLILVLFNIPNAFLYFNIITHRSEIKRFHWSIAVLNIFRRVARSQN